MFGFNVARFCQNAVDSPRQAVATPRGTVGSPKTEVVGEINTRAPFRQNATDSPRRAVATPRGAVGSPKTEVVGEIDTRAPFRSVKAAVSLFGEVASPNINPILKKSKTPEEGVLERETQLHLTLKEVDKFKEQLKNAETTKEQALGELKKVNRTLQELTAKLETISESKHAAIEATEAAKNRAIPLEESISSQPDLSGWKQDVDSEREQYKACAGEVNRAKQELTNLRQDFDSALEAKLAAFQEAADAQHTAKVNRGKLSELSYEISTMREALGQLKFASVQAQKEQSKFMAAIEARLQLKRTAKEQVEKKIQSLREEESIHPELAGNLEDKLEVTTEAIGMLREQLKNVRAWDEDSLRIAYLELDEAKKTLQEDVLEKESSLRRLVECLQLELENVKRDKSQLKEKESKTKLLTKKLQVELDKSKAKIEAALAGETKARNASENMHLKLQELSLEAQSAKREAEEINRIAEALKQEAENYGIVAKEAGQKLHIALKEAEEAKAGEELANAQMQKFTTNSGFSRKIKLSIEEFESLIWKVGNIGNSADMKVATAMAQVEPINAREKEALDKLDACLKAFRDIKAETRRALKKAEIAEAAKQAVERELRKWR